MTGFPEGNAIVYCEGAFNTTNGKTAHGLVRRTSRYRVLSVLDTRYSGTDAGEILDGKANGIPVLGDLAAAIDAAQRSGRTATHFVVGLAPDGGRLSTEARGAVRRAISFGLNVDSGLHDFLSEDRELASLAAQNGVEIRDIRKPPRRDRLHFFSGAIEQVDALKIALLGTDSAVGKRTTAWLLIDGLRSAGYGAELVGTGQTAWMQGAEYSIILDSLINDFVAGEIEHAVHRAWLEKRPDAIVVEGQGSLMNPAYPGGFEILAAARPDVVVLQHAPAREEYDGFPGYPIHPLGDQIRAVELISGKPVVAIAVNHENLPPETIPDVCREIAEECGLPVVDVLENGPRALVATLEPWLAGNGRQHRGMDKLLDPTWEDSFFIELM
jgi:uncharacterized NAD-dependent epimerase/dehydratase family protein